MPANLATTTGTGKPEQPILSGQTVLIADQDAAFICWLGQLLIETGCQVVPATTCRQAGSWMKKLKGMINVVMVNPSLPGSAGLLRALSTTKTRLRVVLVKESNSDDKGASKSSHLALEKPSTPVASPQWSQKLQKALTGSHLARV